MFLSELIDKMLINKLINLAIKDLSSPIKLQFSYLFQLAMFTHKKYIILNIFYFSN